MKQTYKTKQPVQGGNVKSFDWIQELYLREMISQSQDFYYENGYKVMTEKYHLKRGYCCNNSCRHCPYER
jgi:hypothetical protein